MADSVLAFVWVRLGSQLEPACSVAHPSVALPLRMLPCAWLLLWAVRFAIHFVTKSISRSCFWVDGTWGCFWVCAMVPTYCSHESVWGKYGVDHAPQVRDTEPSSFTLLDQPV